MTRRTLFFRTLLLWVLFEIGAAAQVRGPSGATILTSWTRTLITPPVTMVERMFFTAGDLAAGFGDARALAKENQSLTAELANLKSRNATLQTNLQAILQAADDLQTLPVFSGAPARCLYRDLGRGLLLVSMNAGTRSTIDLDTPVLGAGGVIGRVVRVEDRYLWVESLTRAIAAVAVVTPDGSTQGLAEGTGGLNLEIHYVSHRASLTVGQDLVTSGADGIYPPGFPVARITSIHESGGPFLEILARPVADLTKIQSVWLIKDGDTTENSGREGS